MSDPMKTILAIHEANKDAYTIAPLDDFEPPQCYHGLHNVDSDHHSGAAGFLASLPCSHGNEYVCVKFVNWVLTATNFDCAKCNVCGLNYKLNELIFTPIGGQK